jgi:hypothetical protein
MRRVVGGGGGSGTDTNDDSSRQLYHIVVSFGNTFVSWGGVGSGFRFGWVFSSVGGIALFA